MNDDRTPLYALPSMKDEYKEIYNALVLALEGNKIDNQPIYNIKFKNFTLRKSYTEDGKLSWVVERDEGGAEDER